MWETILNVNEQIVEIFSFVNMNTLSKLKPTWKLRKNKNKTFLT